MEAAAEASDDVSDDPCCELCKDKILGQPVVHDDGTYWHFGCDQKYEESARNWEESVDQAAASKAQRKHEKRVKKLEHASRWRDAMKGDKREEVDAPDALVETGSVEVATSRAIDGTRGENEEDLDVDTEREMESEAQVENRTPNLGGPQGQSEVLLGAAPTTAPGTATAPA